MYSSRRSLIMYCECFLKLTQVKTRRKSITRCDELEISFMLDHKQLCNWILFTTEEMFYAFLKYGVNGVRQIDNVVDKIVRINSPQAEALHIRYVMER